MSRTTIFSELKKTVTLAIPLIFTQLLSHVLPVVDTVMAGREPPAVLASVALGTQIFVLIYLFMIGIALVITTQIARHQGAGDRLRIRRSFQQGVWLTAILGALTVVPVALIWLKIPRSEVPSRLLLGFSLAVNVAGRLQVVARGA